MTYIPQALLPLDIIPPSLASSAPTSLTDEPS